MRSFVVCIPRKYFIAGKSRRKRRKPDAGFWRENVALRGHLIALGVDGTDIKPISKKQDWRAWTGFMWIRLGTGSGLL
jgi:hypothetical protein